MLAVRDVALSLGGRSVLSGLDLEVPDRQVVAVLGPSGSGKSTLLRVIAGLQAPDTGTVEWDGQTLDGVPAHRRGFGLMFQDFALFPHKDVAANVAFGLRMAGQSPAATAARVAEVLSWVDLAGYERRAVGHLSGGEQQRVALARALAPAPRLLMLDEPLGSLDRVLRDRLLPELRTLLAGRHITAIYVTHDRDEAFSVADRLVLLRQGRVAQAGSPAELWQQPADEWVARFLGLTNLLPAELHEGWAVTPWGRFPVGPAAAALRGPHLLVVRTDGLHISVGEAAAGEGAHLAGVVRTCSFRGARYLVEVALDGDRALQVELPLDRPLAPGEHVRLQVDPAAVVVLPPHRSAPA